MLARRDIETEFQLVEAANHVGFKLAWDRAGPAELESRSWTITPMVGHWPQHEQATLHDISTKELRAYIVGIANTLELANKHLRKIKDFVGPLI
jgi:hypothetical protein